MNQLKITKRFIEDLEKIIFMASLSCERMEMEVQDMSDTVADTIMESVENCNQSIASVKDFIHRTTTNKYGEKIK